MPYSKMLNVLSDIRHLRYRIGSICFHGFTDFTIICPTKKVFPGGHTSISLTGMLVREQISTAQNNIMTLNSNTQKIECPKIQSQKEIE